LVLLNTIVLVEVKNIDFMLRLGFLIPSHHNWETFPVLNEFSFGKTVTFIVKKVNLVLCGNLRCQFLEALAGRNFDSLILELYLNLTLLVLECIH
jgi:hypothetical protein